MPATRKEIEESVLGGRGGQCEASGVGGRSAAAGAAVGGGSGSGSVARVGGSTSAYPVADGEERGATSLPTLDSTIHTIYRSPSLDAWMADCDSAGNMSRYSLLPPAAAATASIQQMESAAAMMKLACRNRLQDRIPSGTERRNRTPGGDVTGGCEGVSGWRLPAPARSAAVAMGAAGAALGAEAPAPLRGDPELPRPTALGLPLADICEASVARQRAPREPSTSSDEGLGLDRQPSLTDLRSLDSECGNLAAAMPPVAGHRRPRWPHDQPFSGHRIHQSQSPPHDRLGASRQMSASTTFHGLGYTERQGAGSKDAPEAARGPQHSDGQHRQAAELPPVDYHMWSNKIVELQQMSDTLTQGIANFIRIASSSDPQYKDAMPPIVPNDRHGSTVESHFSRKTFDGSSPIATPRTLFSRNGPTVDAERHCDTTIAGRDNCVVSRVGCTVAPADVSSSPDRYESVDRYERGRASRAPASSRCGSYLYHDQSSIRGPPRAGVGDTADSVVTMAAIPSLRVVGVDANEALKRQSAEISGDIGGYRPGVIPVARRQCTGESGDFEPSGPLVNSETTSSVEMGHCSRNCISKEDCVCGARASTEAYPNDLQTLTLFERMDNEVDSTVAVNFDENEDAMSTGVQKQDSSSTYESPENSINWLRGARSETVISSRTNDFVVPDTGLNYTFPPTISGIDEMRAMLKKEGNVNASESLATDSLRCYERNGDTGNETPLRDDTEPKNVEAEHDLKSSNKNVSGCSFGSSRDSNGEPSYSLEQHFLPTTGMSYVNEVRDTDTDRRVAKTNNDVQDERNALGSNGVTSNITRDNNNVENPKKEHTGSSKTLSNNMSTSAVMFKTVNEGRPMENICISTCALKTLLSGHGIMEDVKEMRKLGTAISETNEMAPRLKSFRESMSGISRFSENKVHSEGEEQAKRDTVRHETCRAAEQEGKEKDTYCESYTSVRTNMGTSRVGSTVNAVSERDVATSRERSRSSTPTEERGNSDVCLAPLRVDTGDDSTSATTSASTSLFGGVIQSLGAKARSSSNTSSDSELIAPTNSFEDVPSSSRYNARETLNLVRDLIWKDSTYNTLRPEHDTELPSAASGRRGAEGESKSGVERKAGRSGAAAGAKEPQPQSAARTGVRTVMQPRHRLRHDRSSQTCVAVREFPNIPATESLQRTVKTTNLKGPNKSPNVSPRAGSTAGWASRLYHKTNAAPVRSGPAVPGGWPAVCARPLSRPAPAPPPAASAAPAAGLSRSAGSSPRAPPCSAYTRDPAGRSSASVRELNASRSKDASAADALLADAASLFRAKLEACDRRQNEQRRLQKNRPLSAAARLTSTAPAGPPTLLRMMRSGPSSGRRQPLQEQDSWHQRQQQLQQRQLQLQQRQQQLQQRQLQLQQRQQMQQRQKLLQRQQCVQQAGSWQQRLNQTQLAKPTNRRPTPRTCRSPGTAETCLRDVTSSGCAVGAPGSASLRMLQARLRAGGSLHRGVAAQLWQPHLEDGARGLADCPTRDEGACLASGDLAQSNAPDKPSAAADRSQADEAQGTPQAESHDTQEVQEAGDGKHSTDNADNSQAPIEHECVTPSGNSGCYSNTSTFLNADFVNLDVKISDLSILSDHCTAQYVNFLPSTPVRKREDEDFLREILFSGQGDIFKGSFDALPQSHCVNETKVCDFIKPPDRENSDTAVSVKSEHLIEPPAEFCSNVKAGVEDESTCSSQAPRVISVTANQDGSTVSIPPADGHNMTHTGDAGLKSTCSRVSSDSSIQSHSETDTNNNVADFDQLAGTIEVSSDSDANQYSSDEDNAIPSHTSCSRAPSLIVDSERKLENHTVKQNDMSERNTLHRDGPMPRSIRKLMALGKKNTVCGFDGEKCSSQETDVREKCGNDVTNAVETAGNNSSNLKDNAFIILPLQSLSPSVGDENKEQSNVTNSYVEQQVTYQEKPNGSERNVADGRQNEKDLNAFVRPSCTTPPIKSSLVKLCDETMNSGSTANNDVAHKPSVQKTIGAAKSNKVTTEQNEEDNSTENTVNQNDSKKHLDGMVQNISVSQPNKKSHSSLRSEGSSLNLWCASSDDEGAMDNRAEPKTTVQEECKEMIPRAAGAYGQVTRPCLKQDLLADVPHTKKCLTDVAMVDAVNKTYGYEENDGNVDTLSPDLQSEDSFRDAEDYAISNTSLNNGDLTDASSISDPFSTLQFLSDSDDGPTTPVFGTAAPCRLSTEPTTSCVDDCFNQLCAFLVNSQEECTLHETGVINDASAEINERIMSVGTDTTSYAVAPSDPASETSSSETHDAQQAHVAVSPASSWATVSSVSFSVSPEEASNSSLTEANTQNKVGNSQEHVDISSDNSENIRDAAAYESCCTSCSGLLSEEDTSSLVTTDAKNEVENNALQMESPSNNAKCTGDAAADVNYTISSSELATETNISSLVVDGSQNELQSNTEHLESSSDNAECIQDTATDNADCIQGTEAIETSGAPSSEVVLEAVTSYLTLVGAQTIFEHVESSSDNSANFRGAAADESYTTCSPESANEENASSLVVAGTQNKFEVNEEDVECSSDNTESDQDRVTHETYITASSELLVEEITSSLAIVGAQNISEKVESSSHNAERNRVAAEDEGYTIRSSELATETNISSLVVAVTQNKEEINVEDVESSSDSTESLQDTLACENYLKTSSELPTEANSSCPAILGAKNKLESVLEHVESFSDDVEGIQDMSACENHTPVNDAMTGTQEDESCAVASKEDISEEIPVRESTTSWETLSENSYTTDEDQTDTTRESQMTTPSQHRRRRHRRDVQWRAARSEDEEDRRLYDLVLASPEVEVHLSEALSHSESEQPLLTPGPRLAAVGTAGGTEAEVLVAALAGVAMVDADAESEDATDILYGTRDLHSAAVEAAVACVVDSELRDISHQYMRRLGGCLLVDADDASQAPMRPEDDACCRMDETSSSGVPPLSQSTTPPASPPPSAPGLESTPSSCSLHDRPVTLSEAAGDPAAEVWEERPRSHAIATLLTVCVFLAAYSSCLLLDPNTHLS